MEDIKKVNQIHLGYMYVYHFIHSISYHRKAVTSFMQGCGAGTVFRIRTRAELKSRFRFSSDFLSAPPPNDFFSPPPPVYENCQHLKKVIFPLSFLTIFPFLS